MILNQAHEKLGLLQIRCKVSQNMFFRRLRDSNGNTIGHVKIKV